MFERIQRIHFIGVGGSGMSGIAEVLLNRGYRVSGSDLKLTSVTQRLIERGARIHGGHAPGNLDAADVVVVSSAVKPDNPEIEEARCRQIPIIPRAEMLAELMRGKYGIAVAGTHGKTTTTSLVAGLTGHGGLDPTVVLGGRLNALGSNAKLGTGEFMVVEADESDRSFLLLSPTLAIVTNIDQDHMESYAGMDDLKSTFVQFVNKVPFYGAAVLCRDDAAVVSILPQVKRRVITYGFGQESDLRVSAAEYSGYGSRFELDYRDRSLGPFRLNLPGRHNVLNAAAAQLLNWMGLPSGVAAGMADSKVPDNQTGYEKGINITLAGQAGANLVYESAGMLASILSCSLESLVIDNDMLGSINRTVRGIEVNEETLSAELIADVVSGPGHFLGSPQTLDLMQREYVYPEIGDRDTPDNWLDAGGKDSRARAHEYVQRVLAEHRPAHIGAETDARIRAAFPIHLPQQ